MATVPNIVPLANTHGSGTGSTINVTVTAMSDGSGCYFGLLNTSNNTVNRISSISGGGTWTRVSGQGGSGSSSMELWYLQNATAGTTAVTVNLAASISYRWVYGEFSGILASGSLDTSVGNFAANQTSSWTLASGATGTTTTSVRLVICLNSMYGTGKGGGNNLPSTYTALVQDASGEQQIRLDYKTKIAAAGTESATVTGSGAANADIGVVVGVFKPVTTVIQQQTSNIVNQVTGTGMTIAQPFTGNTQIICTGNVAAATVTQTNVTWTRIAHPSGTSTACEMWYADNVPSNAGTTITFGNSCEASYSEWYGLLPTGSLDKTVNTTTNCTSGTTTNLVTGTTATTSSAPELALAVLQCVINGKGGTWSSNLNSYSSIYAPTAGGPSMNVLYKILTSTGTASTGATLNPTLQTNQYTTILSTFQQTASSTTSCKMEPRGIIRAW